jgi:Ni,Fe-hydrogenase III component G
MTIEQALSEARALVAAWITADKTPEAGRLDVTIAPENLVAAVRELHRTPWGFLSAVTGLDAGPQVENLEALYHFCSGSAVLTLRVPVPRAVSVIPSICEVIPSASFFERELAEMFGINVVGTPDPSHLYLPDDWPDQTFPMRKDFQAEGVTHANP